MRKTKLKDGTEVFCIKAPEAKMLDHHVDGYLQHGISIEDNDVIFDVGANIGIFGIRAIQSKKNVKVYCFEPIPDIADVLNANSKKFGENQLIVEQMGLSDTTEQVEFTYFPNTPALSTFKPEEWENDPKEFNKAVKGSMRNPPPEMKWMRLIPTAFSPLIANYLRKGKKKVQCQLNVTSDIITKEQIDKIDLLKVDCEGAELSVLNGINSDHWPLIKSVVVEVHDIDGRLNAIESMLRKQGFEKIHVEKESGLENTMLYNIFAVRND